MTSQLAVAQSETIPAHARAQPGDVPTLFLRSFLHPFLGIRRRGRYRKFEHAFLRCWTVAEA
jgi:hypothetical protein